uniref:N-acetyl-gamma-glutamyl-phosphate reductase (AGPR) (N-acetyl-glutamate semialdehyde dehydrogenase) (NAGSA dehydrogenase) n=1 Tax=mine drainage metagenome TaxID=410659 RepID=E6PZX9_9ZZZZ
MSQAIQTAIVGVTGYAGAELVRLLVRHPRLAGKPPVLAGRIEPEEESRGGIPLSQIHPALIDSQGTGNLRLRQFRWEMIEDLGVDVLFLATPHEYSRTAVFEARRRNIRVIDLSGAWRLESSAHRAVYAFEDEGSADALAMQAEAVYGMPELHRHALHGAGLIANPGCYATAAILALKPLLAAGIVDPHCGIVCDAKSGVSGAGKAPTAKTHFMYAADNFSAYGVFSHRHAGELIEQLEIDETSITFTPHLLPIPRGILATQLRPLPGAAVADKDRCHLSRVL